MQRQAEMEKILCFFKKHPLGGAFFVIFGNFNDLCQID